jgi:hypothetical protein
MVSAATGTALIPRASRNIAHLPGQVAVTLVVMISFAFAIAPVLPIFF